MSQPTGLTRQPSEEGIDRKVISLLLRPRSWAPPPEGTFPLSSGEVIWLCDQTQGLFEAEATLLNLTSPVKIFGDIHGQYADLMRLFDQYGAPRREDGDISLVDYLFLGDYVDRGKHSLECICLLLALKMQFPNRVHLVRGNHESPEVNARDGFLHECVQRLGGRQQGVAAWRRLNLLFEWLPMGAVVNGCILCVHGGIGAHVESPAQIAALDRPLRMGGPHSDLMLDLLWSDPTATDEVKGIHTNEERGHPVVCYGPDRVAAFLERNELSLIVRGHECVLDGFQRFASGRLITVFSATNYCNRWANAGAILLVGKDLELVPKIIYPLEDLEDAWLRNNDEEGAVSPPDDLRDMRPPTPPRDVDSPRESPRAAPRGAMAPPPVPLSAQPRTADTCQGVESPRAMPMAAPASPSAVVRSPSGGGAVGGA